MAAECHPNPLPRKMPPPVDRDRQALGWPPSSAVASHENNPSRRMELPHWCARAEDGHVDTRAQGPRRSGAKYYRPCLSPIGRLEGTSVRGAVRRPALSIDPLLQNGQPSGFDAGTLRG